MTRVPGPCPGSGRLAGEGAASQALAEEEQEGGVPGTLMIWLPLAF